MIDSLPPIGPKHFKAGMSLKMIRDERLFREDYESFNAFCIGEYQMAESDAKLLINYAERVLLSN